MLCLAPCRAILDWETFIIEHPPSKVSGRLGFAVCTSQCVCSATAFGRGARRSRVKIRVESYHSRHVAGTVAQAGSKPRAIQFSCVTVESLWIPWATMNPKHARKLNDLHVWRWPTQPNRRTLPAWCAAGIAVCPAWQASVPVHYRIVLAP